jgi:hypothetical protein
MLPALEPHQRALAIMIDEAMQRGQRGDGIKPEYWKPWTNRALAERAVVSENSVANWRDPDRRMPPEDIGPLLKVFYGTIERHSAEKAKMQQLWRKAHSFLTENSPEPTRWDASKPASLQGAVRLVTLRAHEPLRGNDETLRLMVTLIITPDGDLMYRGRGITIGLTNALLSLDSDHWQPAYQSLASERNHPHFALDASGARIVGPIDATTGMITGAPLGDEPLAVIEPIANGDGPVHVTICASRGSFRVLAGTTGGPQKSVSRNQDLVLNALFHEQLHDRDNHDRAILARSSIKPRQVSCP